MRPLLLRQWHRPRVEQLEERVLLDSALNQLFVQQTYRDLLQREADPSGLAFWSSLVDSGVSRNQVVLRIEGSLEYRTNQVNTLYETLHHRAADPSGLNSFVAFLEAGGTVEQAKASILGSEEYFQRAGGNNSAFLTALYHDVLSRAVDPPGAILWGQLLALGSFVPVGNARGLVAMGVLVSPEARQDHVQEVYQAFHHRDVDPSGLTTFVGLLQQGVRDEDIIADIVGSEEYFARATAPSETQPPTKALTLSLTSPSGTMIQGAVHLSGTASGTGSALAALSYHFDNNAAIPVAFDPASGAFDRPLDLATLVNGPHTLTVSAADVAGNTAAITLNLTLAIPFGVTSHTPLDGATDVGVTYRPQIFFSQPVDPSSLTGDSFYASFSGQKLPATILPADNGGFAWLFFTGPMPNASKVQVTVDGSTIHAQGGGALLDAAGNGKPGSLLTYSFTTVSLAPVPGTTLSGTIVDPGPDLIPGTADDVQTNPDGTTKYLLPIAGVKVFLIGMEDQAQTTDANGHFQLTSVPAGDVKLVIEGKSATAPPAGFYFPEMVMDTNVKPGIDNFAMGMPVMYLPRIRASILQNVDRSKPTHITVNADSALGLTPQQQQLLSVDVQPGTLVGPDGKKLASGQVGISVVPPELVDGMLPPGVLKHTFDITVQAPGIATFSTPAPMTFPNVFNAAPGTQLDFLSFDHTTGRLVIEGTATVSADGLSVKTDPGTGITHPGWHGLTPPGACGGPGGPPLPTSTRPGKRDIVNQHPAVVKPLISGETGTLSDPGLTWKAPPGPTQPPPSGCKVPPRQSPPQSYLAVRIDVDGPLDQFMKQDPSVTGGLPLTSQQFVLSAGQPGTFIFAGVAQTYDEMHFVNFIADALYGAKITVTEIRPNPDGSRTFDITPYYLFRWLDVIDANNAIQHTGTTAAFERTLYDPSQTTQRTKDVNLFLPSSTPTQFKGTDPEFQYPGSFTGNDMATWTFTPSAVGSRTDTAMIMAGDTAVGTLSVFGTANAPVTLGLNLDGFKQTLLNVLQNCTGDQIDGVTYNYYSRPNDVIPYARIAGGQAFIDLYTAWVNAGPSPDPNQPLLNGVADDLFAEVTQDFGRVNDGSLGQAYTVVPGAGDVTASWVSLFPPPPGGDVLKTVYGQEQDNGSGLSIQRTWFSSSQIGEAAKAWGMAETLRPSTSSVQVAVGRHVDANGGTTFGKYLANTVGHELGHAFGLKDGYFYVADADDPDESDDPGVSIFPYDIMGAKSRNDVDLTFGQGNREMLQASLGAQPNDSDETLFDALRFYKHRFDTPMNPCDPFQMVSPPLSCAATNNPEAPLDPSQELPQLVVLRSGQELTPGAPTVFDPVAADGPGGASTTVNLVLSNPGFQPLTINSVGLTDGSQGFSIVTPNPAGTTVAPGTSTTLTVQFDPTTAGNHQDSLTITSNAADLPSYQIVLQGTAFPQAPTARLTLNKNNNLGSVPVNGGNPAQIADLATITNDGAQALGLSAIQLADGGASFTLIGLPADLATNPITLATGQSFTFGVQYSPDKVGLERALIQVTTNDPNQPLLHLSAVGTGLADTVAPHWGDDFIAIETPNLPGSFPLRAKSDDNGNFSFFLPPNQFYHLVIFDPQTGLVAHGYGTTPQSGQAVDLSANLVLGASIAPDTGGDGLPDDVEFAIGLSPKGSQVSADGIDYFTHVIIDHTDPLAATPVITGVLASLALQGEATAVTLQGLPATTQGQTAYVATGSYGLAIVNASDFQKPIILGQIQLNGNSTDVSVDANLRIAAVASNGGGLNFVDVSNPTQPKLLKNINVNTALVRVVDGVAYAAVGTGLQAYDLVTGTLLQSLDFGGTVFGIARDGSFLYTLGPLNTLRVIDLSARPMVTRGTVTLPSGSGSLFVGNGVAYVTTFFTGRGVPVSGYITADVSNPDSPTYLGDLPSSYAASQAIALNGSGIALTVGSDFNGAAVDVFDARNPSTSGQFLTRFALPVPAVGVAIGEGIGFIADGSGGLEVVNYLPFDASGVPPTVSISTPSLQVLEGSTIPVTVNAADDVQVRNVELLVNGQVVQNSVSFPFSLSFIAPNITATSNTVTVQVQATDTGGNSSLSNSLVVQLLRDTTPPTIRYINPADGTGEKPGRQLVQVLFSKPLAAATVTTSTFQLLDGAGNPVAPLDLRLHEDDQLVQLSYSPLHVGRYQLVIDAAAVTDRAGNPLGAAPVQSGFRELPTGNGTITTVAGNGTGGYSGDGGPATQAQLSYPFGVAVGPDGSLYIADNGNLRIRRVGPDGIITTVAGNGTAGYSGDGGPATQAQLNNPSGVAVGPDGSLFIADSANNRIRRVGPDGLISTVAGNGTYGFSGDGGPATQAALLGPDGVAVGPDGSLYIAATGNGRIRRVGPDGVITTVAGSTVAGNNFGFSGDGGPATQAQLNTPIGVTVGPDGSLYIADWGNGRIRRVGPDGVITTVAGNGYRDYSYGGDGGPATQAGLDPIAVGLGPDGALYIADFQNRRIRWVGPDGLITTVAGNGTAGYSGDGGPASQAELDRPTGVALGPDGSLFIADSFNNNRIRRVVNPES